jgi:hypothetical protein
MIDFIMIYVYGLLTVCLLVDAGLTMLANPTHIRIKGVMHLDRAFEGEVWKCTCHSLLALLP